MSKPKPVRYIMGTIAQVSSALAAAPQTVRDFFLGNEVPYVKKCDERGRKIDGPVLDMGRHATESLEPTQSRGGVVYDYEPFFSEDHAGDMGF